METFPPLAGHSSFEVREFTSEPRNVGLHFPNFIDDTRQVSFGKCDFAVRPLKALLPVLPLVLPSAQNG